MILNQHKQDSKELTEIPFSVADEAPIFMGCENISNNIERKQCTADKITAFVNRNFNIKLAKELGLAGQQRIVVVFNIDKNGDIYDVKSRASHPELKAEALRVVNLLPQMIPGRQNGETVVVSFSLPITFQVSE